MATVDAERLEDLARAALASGEEEAALAEIAPAAERSDSARLWQFTGLLQRSLDQYEDAVRSFSSAARLAPEDASIASGLARTALEAGIDSVAMFERALRLAPASGTVLLGYVAAKLAAGRGFEAEAQLDLVVGRSPTWIDGHVQLAQLRSMLGNRDQSTASLERALAAQPGNDSLWTALFNLILSQMGFAALDEAVERARSVGLPESHLSPFAAIAAAEQEHSERADSLFGALTPLDRREIGVWHVRHLLRGGRLAEASALIDSELEGERAMQFWPYASIAWRLTGDPRWEWLETGGKVVSTFDLADRLPPLDQLAAVLRSLHVATGEYLDQSVRGGTQTDGPLLSRIKPEILQLRKAVVSAVQRYAANLPPTDPAHPLLRERRDRRTRFSGSWSVRLQGSGFHANHVHPLGWISSALYVALPDRLDQDGPEAGWLKVGEPPPELRVNLPPVQLIEPKPGRLVLFPSWMWHGTEPFSEGERLTVAFDVRPPI